MLGILSSAHAMSTNDLELKAKVHSLSISRKRAYHVSFPDYWPHFLDGVVELGMRLGPISPYMSRTKVMECD